jgi:putative ABC transport system permease protein
MPIISDRYNSLDNKYMRIVPNDNFIGNNYDILYGNIPKSINEIVLKVDINNNVDSDLLKVFNIDDDIEYSEIIDRKLRVILNDDYYVKNGDYYFINNDSSKLYENSVIELRVVGVVREKEVVDDNSYFYYSSELIDHIIETNSKSKIVNDQLKSNYNILGIDMDRDNLLSYLGYEKLPSGINIYVSNLYNKKIVLDKLDLYNDNNEKLIYIDAMNDATQILKDLINVVTIILVIFSIVSIIVSSLMVFILTNNRVMERVKEIGILRSLGARNKDITRLFNIENFIIGIVSSVIGIIFIMLISNPVNILLEDFIGDNIFKIYSDLVIIGIIFNILIVGLSGYIPSKMASKKRIIDCIKNN